MTGHCLNNDVDADVDVKNETITNDDTSSLQEKTLVEDYSEEGDEEKEEEDGKLRSGLGAVLLEPVGFVNVALEDDMLRSGLGAPPLEPAGFVDVASEEDGMKRGGLSSVPMAAASAGFVDVVLGEDHSEQPPLNWRKLGQTDSFLEEDQDQQQQQLYPMDWRKDQVDATSDNQVREGSNEVEWQMYHAQEDSFEDSFEIAASASSSSQCFTAGSPAATAAAAAAAAAVKVPAAEHTASTLSPTFSSPSSSASSNKFKEDYGITDWRE